MKSSYLKLTLLVLISGIKLAISQTKEEIRFFKDKYIKMDSVEYTKLYKGSKWKELYRFSFEEKKMKQLPFNRYSEMIVYEDSIKYRFEGGDYTCASSHENTEVVAYVYVNCSEDEKGSFDIIKLTSQYLVVDYYQKLPDDINYKKQYRIVYTSIERK